MENKNTVASNSHKRNLLVENGRIFFQSSRQITGHTYTPDDVT